MYPVSCLCPAVVPCCCLPLPASGKDYRDSVLKDAKTSLIVIAGGDPDLRQAVTDGEVKQVGPGGREPVLAAAH